MTRVERQGSNGSSDTGDTSGLHAKVRRAAWGLGLLAIAFYLGFIAWNVFRGITAAG